MLLTSPVLWIEMTTLLTCYLVATSWIFFVVGWRASLMYILGKVEHILTRRKSWVPVVLRGPTVGHLSATTVHLLRYCEVNTYLHSFVHRP